jgi:hypothetical protein
MDEVLGDLAQGKFRRTQVVDNADGKGGEDAQMKLIDSN